VASSQIVSMQDGHSVEMVEAEERLAKVEERLEQMVVVLQSLIAAHNHHNGSGSNRSPLSSSPDKSSCASTAVSFQLPSTRKTSNTNNNNNNNTNNNNNNNKNGPSPPQLSTQPMSISDVALDILVNSDASLVSSFSACLSPRRGTSSSSSSSASQTASLRSAVSSPGPGSPPDKISFISKMAAEGNELVTHAIAHGTKSDITSSGPPIVASKDDLSKALHSPRKSISSPESSKGFTSLKTETTENNNNNNNNAKQANNDSTSTAKAEKKGILGFLSFDPPPPEQRLVRSRSFVLSSTLKKNQAKEAQQILEESAEIDSLLNSGGNGGQEEIKPVNDKSKRRSTIQDKNTQSSVTKKKRDFFSLKRKGKEVEKDKDRDKDKEKESKEKDKNNNNNNKEKPKDKDKDKEKEKEKQKHEKKDKKKKNGKENEKGNKESQQGPAHKGIEKFSVARINYQRAAASRWTQSSLGLEAAETLSNDHQFYHLNLYYLASSPEKAHKFFADLHQWIAQKEKEGEEEDKQRHKENEEKEKHSENITEQAKNKEKNNSKESQKNNNHNNNNNHKSLDDDDESEEGEVELSLGPIWITTPKLISRTDVHRSEKLEIDFG
jgi:hypothetical protein